MSTLLRMNEQPISRKSAGAAADGSAGRDETGDAATADAATGDDATGRTPRDVDAEREHVDALIASKAGEGAASSDEIGDAESRVIVDYLPVASSIARRYRYRGADADDLDQIARLGLLKAVRGWQPHKGSLIGFILPTVHGELKRFFRDRVSSIRVPRAVYEAQPKVSSARRELEQSLHHRPTSAEVATRSDVSLRLVHQVEQASTMTKPLSTDDNGDWLPELASAAAARDMDGVEARAALRPLVAGLAARERRLIGLRFVRGLSQAQIARALGISQMHVSRLLAATLRNLRAQLEDQGWSSAAA